MAQQNITALLPEGGNPAAACGKCPAIRSDKSRGQSGSLAGIKRCRTPLGIDRIKQWHRLCGKANAEMAFRMTGQIDGQGLTITKEISPFAKSIGSGLDRELVDIDDPAGEILRQQLVKDAVAQIGKP